MRIRIRPLRREHRKHSRIQVISWRVLIDGEWRAVIHRESWAAPMNMYCLKDTTGRLITHILPPRQSEWSTAIEELVIKRRIPMLAEIIEARQREAHYYEVQDQTNRLAERRLRLEAGAELLYNALKMVQRLVRAGEALTHLHIEAIDAALERVDGPGPTTLQLRESLKRIQAQ